METMYLCISANYFSNIKYYFLINNKSSKKFVFIFNFG